MDLNLYKCCFCLNTVKTPIVMCHQTHVACFDCVCEHMRHPSESNNTSKCPVCRQGIHLRFDRFITELAASLKTKKRKRSLEAIEVFEKLLTIKKKNKYKLFNRTLRKFALAAHSDEELEQINTDIDNIIQARESAKRLLENKLYDSALYSRVSI